MFLKLQKWHLLIWSCPTGEVTINHEPAENWFKHVMIQIGWDAKLIAIQLGVTLGVYIDVCLRETYCRNEPISRVIKLLQQYIDNWTAVKRKLTSMSRAADR